MKPTSFLPFFQLVASQGLTYWADLGYPPCTQGCLENIYETQACSLANACFCTSSTSSSTSCLCLTSGCLCETSSWLIAIVQCIGKTCGADNVTIAVSVADSGCSGSGYPLAIASPALVSYGMAAVPTGASSPTSTTSSESPTSNANAGSTPNPTTANSNPATTSTASASTSSASSGSGGGSQPNPILAAYVVPSVLAGITVIAAFIFWYWRPDQARNFLCSCCGLCLDCCCNPSSEKDEQAVGHSQTPEVHAGNHGNNSFPMQNRGPVYAQQYASPPLPTP